MLKINHRNAFFTSDCHFGHKSIIEYCDRPFCDVWDMRRVMIERWNSVVDHNDTVFILGDFAFGNKEYQREIYNELYGKKILIKGNHDRDKDIPTSSIEGIYEQLLIRCEGDEEIPEQDIFLNHYPMHTWHNVSRGSWQLFGHIHTIKGQKSPYEGKLSPLQYDVGVDNNDFIPLSFQQIKTIITRQLLGYE